MKKIGLMFLMGAVMLVCMFPITAGAVFPGLSGFPSTISSGNIWIIAGILVIAIIAAIIIIKKNKSKKNGK